MKKTLPYTLALSEFNAEAFFSGTWHEQARTQNRFQEGCVHSTAFYTVDKPKINIENTCILADGTLRQGPPMSAMPRLFYPNKATYNVFVGPAPGGLYNVLYAENVDKPDGEAIVAGKFFDKVWILTRDINSGRIEVLKAIIKNVDLEWV